MATSLITITNVSKQVIPILVNEIKTASANTASNIPARQALQMQINPGAQVTIERQRVDIGQLEELKRKRLITY